jgi:hypothetical protein
MVGLASVVNERILAMNDIDPSQTDEAILTPEVSDEALESAAGPTAGASLWSSFDISGCTC